MRIPRLIHTFHISFISDDIPFEVFLIYVYIFYLPCHILAVYNFIYHEHAFGVSHLPSTYRLVTVKTFSLLIEGSLEVKLPTIWRDEKQSRAEAQRRGRLEERRSEEKE